MCPAISALSDPAKAAYVSKAKLTAAALNSSLNALRTGVVDLNDVVADLASNFAAASAPENDQGRIWYDTTNSQWKGDPDGSGADIVIAHNVTGKPPSVLNVDTTAVSPGLGTTGSLITYTIPANTLNANGKILKITCWGTKAGANAVTVMEVRLGGVSIDSIGTSSGTASWHFELLYIRTASSTQDWLTKNITGQFDPGDTSDKGGVEVASGADAEDDTATIAFELNVTSINGGDQITQEGLMVELLN